MPPNATTQSLMPVREARLVSKEPVDALDEFAFEDALVTSGPASHPAAVRGGRVARVSYGALAAIAASVTMAVGVTAWIIVSSDRTTRTRPGPEPSPLRVLYPDHPGAAILQAAAAALPAVLAAESTLPLPLAPPDSTPLLRAALAPAQAFEPQQAFDVRGAVHQAAVADAGAAPVDDVAATPRSADAPPRRLGPPLTVTMLGGAFPKHGRLALLVDVTGEGNVTRVATEDAADVHADVIESVTAAARSWKYEPARRDGAPVPARVRVVVQLRGAE